MVRRGSPVRVRKRALQKPLAHGVFLGASFAFVPGRVVELFLELSDFDVEFNTAKTAQLRLCSGMRQWSPPEADSHQCARVGHLLKDQVDRSRAGTPASRKSMLKESEGPPDVFEMKSATSG